MPTAQDYQDYYSDIEKAQKGETYAGVGKGAVSGASTGMTVGSVIPGVGTLAGAGIGALVGGIAGGLSAGPTMAEKENARRLRELLRKQELNQLGLTEEEKQSMYNQQIGAISKAQEDVKALQGGIASSLATGAGRAATQRALSEEMLMAQRAAAERAILGEDLKRKAEQQKEIDTRLADVSKQKEENKTQMIKSSTEGINMIGQEIQRIKTVRGAKPTPEQLSALSSYTGMSPEQLGPALEYFASNPESANILTDILSAGKTGVLK